MGAVEERVSFLEAKMVEQSAAVVDLRGLVIALDQKVDRRFDDLGQEMSRQFRWVVGIEFTILLVIMTGMFGIITKLL